MLLQGYMINIVPGHLVDMEEMFILFFCVFDHLVFLGDVTDDRWSGGRRYMD